MKIVTITNLLRALCLAVLFCLSSSLTVLAKDPAVMPAPPPVSAAQFPQAGVDVALSIQGAANLGGFQVDVVYDRSQSSLTGVTLSDFLGGASGCNAGAARCAASLGPLDLADRSRVGGYSFGAGSGANGNGVLAVLHLDSTLSGAALSLTLTNALVVDTFGDPIQGATLTLTTVERKSYLPLIQKK